MEGSALLTVMAGGSKKKKQLKTYLVISFTDINAPQVVVNMFNLKISTAWKIFTAEAVKMISSLILRESSTRKDRSLMNLQC